MDREKNSYADGREADISEPPTEHSEEKVGRLGKELFWGFIKEFVSGIALAAGGYLFGTAALPFGTHPLGLALLCSAGKKAPLALLGLCLSALEASEAGDAPMIYITAYALSTLLRLIISLLPRSSHDTRQNGSDLWGRLFREPIILRALTAATAAFLIGAYFFFRGDGLYYHMYALLISVSAAFFATLLFSLGLSKGIEVFSANARVGVWQAIGEMALLGAIVYSLGGISFFSVYLAPVAAFAIPLLVSHRRGGALGILFSLAGGLAYDPTLTPVFVLGTLAFSLFKFFSVGFGTASAVIASTALSFYLSGISALGTLIAPLFCGGVGFYMVSKLLPETSSQVDNEKSEIKADEQEADTSAAEAAPRCVLLPPDALDGLRLDATEQKTRELGSAFSSLSTVLTEMRKRGSISDEADPSEDGGEWRDIMRAYEGTDPFASDLDAFSELIADAMVTLDEEFRPDTSAGEALMERLSKEELLFEGNDRPISLAVFGSRRRFILLRREGGFTDNDTAAIAKAAAQVYDLPFKPCGDLSLLRDHNDSSPRLLLCQRETVSVRHCRTSLPAEGENGLCGDSAGLLHDGASRLYSFISDGMGSGKDAAVTSGLASLFLCKLLGASCPASTVLRMVNSYLRGRNSSSYLECSATLDLFELDLMTGRATFYKSGASPTYVFRDGAPIKIRAKSPPLGIIKEVGTKKVSFRLKEGDTVIMVSDGVTGGKEDLPRLYELIRGAASNGSPERIAELVIRYAKSEGIKDDISVIVLKIEPPTENVS